MKNPRGKGNKIQFVWFPFQMDLGADLEDTILFVFFYKTCIFMILQSTDTSGTWVVTGIDHRESMLSLEDDATESLLCDR